MKKRQVFVVLLSLCGLFFLLIGGQQVQADEHQEYGSPAGVGFYGSYEYPEEESRPDDSSAEESTERLSPEKPIENVPPQHETGTNQLTSKPVGRVFPQTGEMNNRYIGLIGSLIVMMAILIVLINRKKSKKENV